MNLINSNTSKSVFGAAAVAIALMFSAYTSAEKQTTVFRFYNTSGSVSTDKADFVYYADDELCEGEPVTCSEEWDIHTTTEPADGQLLNDPAYSTASKIPDSDLEGQFVAPMQ